MEGVAGAPGGRGGRPPRTRTPPPRPSGRRGSPWRASGGPAAARQGRVRAIIVGRRGHSESRSEAIDEAPLGRASGDFRRTESAKLRTEPLTATRTAFIPCSPAGRGGPRSALRDTCGRGASPGGVPHQQDGHPEVRPRADPAALAPGPAKLPHVVLHQIIIVVDAVRLRPGLGRSVGARLGLGGGSGGAGGGGKSARRLVVVVVVVLRPGCAPADRCRRRLRRRRKLEAPLRGDETQNHHT